MKLLNDLYQIVSKATTESGFTATIKLFADHAIYAGHFPGHPITPGVVQMQIVHELVENHFGKEIKLVSVDDCKFLKIINPEERDKILISFQCIPEDSFLHVKAVGTGKSGEEFFKLKGSYLIV